MPRGFLTPKSTRINPSASHPKKTHKRLRFGYTRLRRKRISAQWLPADGYMTKLPGYPPNQFLHRKEVEFPKRGKRGKATRGKPNRKPSGLSKMSNAAKKAWATRRRRNH
jgi:hypothetical protein